MSDAVLGQLLCPQRSTHLKLPLVVKVSGQCSYGPVHTERGIAMCKPSV